MTEKNVSKIKLPVGGRIGRLANIILQETNPSITEKVMKDFHVFESTKSYSEKARWIGNMIERIENYVSPKLCTKIMERCGRKCCGITTRKNAKQFMSESKSIKEFLNKLNKHGIGGGRLRLKGKNTVTGGYDRCYCGQVKKTQKPFPTKTYCQCSVGWYKQLFESALGKEVEVELISSIITGAKTCEFLIHI